MKLNKLIKPGFLSLACLLTVAAWGAQDKVLRIFRGGEIIQEHNIEDIDYIEIQDLIEAPENVNATPGTTSITIKWTAVDGATYDVYRSADNVTFTCIAQNLTTNSYTDEKPLTGANYYRIKANVNGTESGYTSTVSAALPDNGLPSGIYLGINAFNQALYNYPVLYLNESSIEGFNSFVDGLTMKNGTLLYYSVDQALNTIQGTTLPADVSNVAIVTFTDGLDQGSMMLNDTYQTDMEYLDAINKRIKEETVAGQKISAFSIGVRGGDVSDIAMFRENLAKLASTAENAIEVTSMSEVNAKFKEIAEKLSQSNYIQTINLKMPGVANGTKVRFTFDNPKNAANSQIYIEGVFNLKEKALEEIVYEGLYSTSGSKVNGQVDGIFVTFTFEGVRTEDNVLLKSEFTDEWTYIPSNSTWQINSEFDKDENSDIENKLSSAAIMLVLDCSSSLADDFAKAQSNAKDFINTLFIAVGGTEKPGDNGTTIYSTTPKDLTLAIWKEGKRYYLTQEQYEHANLSDAVIEGLTIIGGGESFILSLRDVQTNSISSVGLADKMYGDIMPTASQARIISARWADVQNALSIFGGSKLGSRYYTTATTLSNDYYTNVLAGSGGYLIEEYSSYSPYIRGVISTDYSGPKFWQDPDDLKLSVKVNGERKLIGKEEFSGNKNDYEEIEGILIINGTENFILALQDAQNAPISSVYTAKQLYGDIMPSATQALIISARWDDVQNALYFFGGSKLGFRYYTTATTLSNSYFTNVLNGSGGYLREEYSSYSPYIRGVITLETAPLAEDN